VWGDHPAIRRIGKHAERASQVECTVLISGATGTGKEVWAKLIHRIGPRSSRPFVPVNCAALTPTLAESQLFGHERGAFTGASGASLGVFRAAEGGIVFLDEVGEMPLELQPKLLRVLQEHEVTPVGAASPVDLNVQVIAATNRKLEEEVEAGRFREDLYFRLNMVELQVPSLRQRAQDIPSFIEFFSARFAEKYNRPRWSPDAESIEAFCSYSWPGNIRQLAHVIEQSYVLDCAPTVPNQIRLGRSEDELPFLNLGQLRVAAVKQALSTTKGHKGRAARLLGVHANTLTRMLVEIEEESPV
jgi:DNA-binding NtrC family response regulator